MKKSVASKRELCLGATAIAGHPSLVDWPRLGPVKIDLGGFHSRAQRVHPSPARNSRKVKTSFERGLPLLEHEWTAPASHSRYSSTTRLKLHLRPSVSRPRRR